MKKNKPLPRVRTVTVEHNGKTYYGSYTVEHQYVTVTYGMATKTAQCGQSAEAFAALLLSEMVSAGKTGF